METRRQQIIALLQKEAWPIEELASHFSVHIKVIHDDIAHIQKSLKKDYALVNTPFVCYQCGFRFQKRTKVKKPSRCPKCKTERISDAMIQLIKT